MSSIDSAVTPIDQSLLPAAVRNGGTERRKQYEAALSFERTLVTQLTQQLSKSFGATGSGDGDDDGGSGDDAVTSQIKQQLPGTLADALMSNGGLGIAAQIDQMWHPNATSTSVSANQTGTQTADGGGVSTAAGGSPAPATAAPAATSGGASA